MPPPVPLPPPEGDVVPYPMDILALPGDRWLTPGGEIIDSERGVGVPVYPNTRRYWEGRAAVAGYSLDELLAGTD